MKRFIAALAAAFFMGSGTAQAMSGEPCVLTAFSDKTRFYRIPTSDVLSSFMLEKMMEAGRFSLREGTPVPVTGGGESTEEFKKIGKAYDAPFIISGTVRKLSTSHRVYRDLGHAASAAGDVIGMIGGGILGSVIGAFGRAATVKDTLSVTVDVSVISASDGRPVWTKEISVDTPISSDAPEGPFVTVAGHEVNKYFAAAMEAVATEAVKSLTEDVGANRVIVR